MTRASPSWFRGLTANWESIVKNVVLVVTAIWALVQYTSHLQENRVAAVLDYQRQVRADPLYKAWRAVTITNVEQDAAQDAAWASGGAAWKAYSIGIGLRARDGFEEVLSLYDGLSACMEEGVCDKRTAVRLFGRDATNIYTYYGVYVGCQKLKYGDNDYASGLMALRRQYILQTKGREPRTPSFSKDDCRAPTPTPSS